MKLINSLKSFIERCKRVWMVLKKPTKQEFEQVAKVAALGILIIGALGFIISQVMNLIL